MRERKKRSANSLILILWLIILWLFVSSSILVYGSDTLPYNYIAHLVHIGGGDSAYPETVARGVDIDCEYCHTGPIAVNYDRCGDCHSAGGQYNGVATAIDNWYSPVADQSAVYDVDGKLRPGKEALCLGCHDDGQAFAPDFPDPVSLTAPNVSGMILADGDVPFTVDPAYTQNGSYLNDGNPNTGTSSGCIVLDLGEARKLSHISMTIQGTGKWKIWGGNDLTDVTNPNDAWGTRIIFGNSVIWGDPVWELGASGTHTIQVDKFTPVRYIKIKKFSPWPIPANGIREIACKSDLTFGYASTGHKISCTNCHDMRKTHIDGDQRTYTAHAYNPSDPANYENGYRLTSVNVNGHQVRPMDIPRLDFPWDFRTSNDFALCFSCHSRDNLLGTVTNFWNSNRIAPNDPNLHSVHLGAMGQYSAPSADTDWDRVLDSRMSCTNCHNVHGSPAPAMTRHGELISTVGTLDKAPGMNLFYRDASGKRTLDLLSSIGGWTQFYAPGPGRTTKNGICSMCHNDGTVYNRTPQAVPKPIM